MPPEAHVPLPSQWLAKTAVFPEQEAPTHVVPAGQSRHAPAPSQLPSAPQVFCVMAVHSLSGSTPAEMNPQAPSRPAPFLAVVQAWHVPVHAVSQQTPSAQWPLAQSVSTLQPRPLAFTPHEPLLQGMGALHCAELVQLVKHAVAPQRKGAQSVVVPALQTPIPLHVAAVVWLPFAHDAGVQVVPAG